MWHRILKIASIIVLMLSSILVIPVARVSAETDNSNRADVVASQVSRILAKGDAADVIPVIVSLQPPVLPRNVLASPLEQQQRATAIRAIQRDFVSRHATRITPTERQPQLFSMMFMTMRRSDVVAFTADTAVTGVMQDYLSEPTMDVSTVLIGSDVANLSGYDGTGTSVAVLDTGVQTNHEFLSGKVVAEACFSNAYGAGTDWWNGTSLCPSGTNTSISTSNDVGSATPCVFHGSCDHGTHVAGTVAGKVVDKGSYIMRGVAPGAKIIGIQVFTNLTGGGLSSWSADQILAMEWLIANRETSDWGVLASLNMSLGGGQYWATCDSQAITTPINSLRAFGIATVIASGNDGYLDSISSPGCISTAITVGSSTTNSAIGYSGVTAGDEISPYSNAPAGDNNAANGSGDRLLDLLAPGMYIYSSISSTSSAISYGYKSGTSMATPHVAGAWAVMKQVAANASVSQVLGWLYSSGVTLQDLRPNTNPYQVRYTTSPTTIAQYANRTPMSLPRIQVDDAVSTAVAFVTDTPTSSGVTSTATRSATRTSTRTATKTSTKTRTPAMTRTPSRTPSRTAKATAVSSKPRAFNKLAPTNLRANQPLTLTLSWAASIGASSYEYCIVLSTQRCTNWKSVGSARTATVRGLYRNKFYKWNVRARNALGTTLSNSGEWRFSTIR